MIAQHRVRSKVPLGGVRQGLQQYKTVLSLSLLGDGFLLALVSGWSSGLLREFQQVWPKPWLDHTLVGVRRAPNICLCLGFVFDRRSRTSPDFRIRSPTRIAQKMGDSPSPGGGDSWDVPSSPDVAPAGGGVLVAVDLLPLPHLLQRLPRRRGRPRKAPLEVIAAPLPPPVVVADSLQLLRPGIGGLVQQAVTAASLRESEDTSKDIESAEVHLRCYK
jgi:hypothetical protein